MNTPVHVHCFWVAALVVAAAPFSALAQQPLQWPDTPAAAAAAAWFEAVAAETDEAALSFERTWRSKAKLEERSAAEGAKRMRGMVRQAGVLRPQRVLEHDGRSIAVLARSDKMPMPLRVTFELGDDEPDKLQTMSVRPYGGREPKLGDCSGWKDVHDLLTRALDDTDLPALAAAIVVGDEIVDLDAVGVRSVAEDDAVTREDRFHVGSVAKSMTATLIGVLVERDVLRWDLTLAEALPDLKPRREYRDVTIAQLLRHRGGLPAYLTMDDAEERRLLARGKDPRSRRAAFVEEVLREVEPGGPAGQFLYSNAGYAVLAHVAEHATGKAWEELMQQHVFTPLGMETAVIGWPATASRPGQPRGHFGGGDADYRPQQLDDYQIGPLFAPAGDVSCSVGDLARFVRAHLRGLRGEDGPLRAATVRALHDPGPAEGANYAAGWSLARWGEQATHTHNGSAGTFFAQVEVLPSSNCAVVVVTNAGMIAAPVVEGLISLLRERAAAAR